jgi:hypothetical protein
MRPVLRSVHPRYVLPASAVALLAVSHLANCAPERPSREFAPAAAREALSVVLDSDVLPYWIAPARMTPGPAVTAAEGTQLVRQLRLLYVYAIAISRDHDAEAAWHMLEAARALGRDRGRTSPGIAQ